MFEGESARGVTDVCVEGDSGALLPLLMSSTVVVIVDIASVLGTVIETAGSDNVSCSSGMAFVVVAVESISLAISAPSVGVVVEVTPVMGDADDPDFA